ncbi:hypothetical protein V6N13_064428 [Hibiscus sabdariffa]
MPSLFSTVLRATVDASPPFLPSLAWLPCLHRRLVVASHRQWSGNPSNQKGYTLVLGLAEQGQEVGLLRPMSPFSLATWGTPLCLGWPSKARFCVMFIGTLLTGITRSHMVCNYFGSLFLVDMKFYVRKKRAPAAMTHVYSSLLMYK